MESKRAKAVSIELEITTSHIAQEEVCSVCDHMMEVTYFDFELGIDFKVRTHVAGHVCLQCGNNLLSAEAVHEALRKSRIIMLDRDLHDEVALIEKFITREQALHAGL